MEVWSSLLQIPDPISDQKYVIFLFPFSDLTSEIHIGFQTKSGEILNYFTRIMVITRNLMFNNLKGTSYVKNSTTLIMRDTLGYFCRINTNSIDM